MSDDAVVKHIEDVRDAVSRCLADIVGKSSTFPDEAADTFRRIAIESAFMAGFALGTGLVGNVRTGVEPRTIGRALSDLAWKDSVRRLRVLVGDEEIIAEIMGRIDFGSVEN